MIRLQKTLPEGWNIHPPDVSGVLSDIAQVRSETTIVHLRWPRQGEHFGNVPSHLRVLAWGDRESPEDWVLTCLDDEGRQVPIPEEIRLWATSEVRHLYTNFERLI